MYKINVVEISALPREIKSEMPLEQSGSKLVQDENTSVHAELSLPNGTIDLCKISPFEVSVASRKVLVKSIPKFHTKWNKVLGSKLVRRAKPTRLVKGKIPSICRPPPKPPYIVNVNGDVIGIIEKEDLPYVVPKLKPPPKLPQNFL